MITITLSILYLFFSSVVKSLIFNWIYLISNQFITLYHKIKLLAAVILIIKQLKINEMLFNIKLWLKATKFPISNFNNMSKVKLLLLWLNELFCLIYNEMLEFNSIDWRRDINVIFDRKQQTQIEKKTSPSSQKDKKIHEKRNVIRWIGKKTKTTTTTT